MNQAPRITFGMIVLNGEPFLRHNLRALYPFAHEIIVVEGAAPGARDVATEDGHSCDNTLDVLQRFKDEEDPDNKLQIVTRNGFWSEKDEMSIAYAERATGEYLWQVDSDEFYQPDDMQAVIEMLAADPTITAVSFPMITFWGSPDYIVDGWFLRRGSNIFHRLFKWGVGYHYDGHRPPTVIDDFGRDTRTVHWINGKAMAQHGIYLYHYSLLLPGQVHNKSAYYGNTFAEFSGGLNWAQRNFIELRRPFRVHNVYRYPSWIERFNGRHPEQVRLMWRALSTPGSTIPVRHTDDVERLLKSRWYVLLRTLVRRMDYFARGYRWMVNLGRRIVFKARKILKGTGIPL